MRELIPSLANIPLLSRFQDDTKISQLPMLFLCPFGFSFFSLRQVFLTLSPFLVTPHTSSISLPGQVHRPNLYFTPSNICHHSFSPFSDLNLHVHFGLPPHALATFHHRASSHCDGHCILSDAYPHPSLITTMCSSWTAFTTHN